MKVRIIQISQEPQDTRSEDLSEQENKWSKVEHVHHTNKPVKEHGCTLGNKTEVHYQSLHMKKKFDVEYIP